MTIYDWRDLEQVYREDYIKDFFDELRVDKRCAEEWSLVLDSKNIKHEIVEESNHFTINLHNRDDNDRAARDIIDYVESLSSDSKKVKPLTSDDKKTLVQSTIFAAIFFLFFILTETTENFFHWKYIGTNSAFKVKEGEIWRVVTALFLHGDIAHFLGNLMVGYLSFSSLSIYLGYGSSTLLFLLSGSIGNYINIVFREYHRSLGASTAVFGIIGVMIGLQLFRTYRSKKWMVMVLLFTFLAFLGTAGENTDFGAHLTGILSGFICGVIYHIINRKIDLKSSRVQISFFILTITTIITCWIYPLLTLTTQ